MFITELESPYTVYVNIVPNEILNPIQISYHHNCHFRYLNLSKLDGCPLNVHENLLIKMDKGEVYATIFNQSYYDNYNKKQVNLKYIKYLLFVKPRYYNCRHELLPPNFSIQLDLIKKAFLLEKEYDENLFDVVCNLEAELEAITNKMQYTPFIDE
ncbi:hypothetical protein [Salinibacillus kushneri]|uniref:hypothetical protein n=1 Tax=Salinibacillus kushneri TaxID=237682 RepID=UPI001C660226|nr:hypothetical protein [Salinibacillus kushneri]